MKCVFALVLLLPALADAAQLRVRARENYETGMLNLGHGAGARRYSGFASAFNLWLEEPFRYGLGLTVQRGGFKARGGVDKVNMTTLGVEGKYFPLPDVKWFVRGGLLTAGLDPAGPPKSRWAHGGSFGTGWEFPVWKLGLAPEIGKKFLFGARRRSWRSLYAAIGVHFYVFPK